MTPYLRKKRTSSTANSKEVQSTSNILDSKTISRTKHIADKGSKLKDNAKVICTRSVTLANRERKKKNDNINLQTMDSISNEKPRSTRSNKLSKQNITNKTKLVKSIASNVIIKNKQKGADKKRKVNKTTSKNVSTSKQMSLKESFLNQSKIKKLRSHKNSKEAKNNSVLEKTKSKKLNINKKKMPIYEPLSPENTKDANSEIYEFKFDINDSKERLPTKRKKRATVKKILGNKKNKGTSARHNIQGIKVQKKKPIITKFSDVKRIDPVEENENSVKPQMENEKLRIVKNMLGDIKKNVATSTELKESENVIKPEAANNIVKPQIVSVEDVTDKRITIKDTSRTSNSDDFRPFRPTNIFNTRLILQQKVALNSSLFEKSLSPIMKTSENIHITSPWRASPLCTFSQMRNVFQSTPQNKKFDISTKKLLRPLNNTSIQHGNQTKVRNNLQKNNENMSVEGRVITNTLKLKNSSISRKFGTEITNLDHSLQYNTVDQISERMATDVERFRPNVESVSPVTSKINNVIQFENNECDKYSNELSLQKNLKKEANEINRQNNHENIINTLADEQKENSDPQPGPSGLQTHSHFNEQRVLRQSNLNNFLNITDVPQSTVVRTPHGIFGDAASTPINGRPMTNIDDSSMVLGNAFGFNDDISDQDIPLTQLKSANVKEEKLLKPLFGIQNVRKFARLSIGEIKNLLVHNTKHVHNKENMQTEKREEIDMHMKKGKKSQIDIANFSDTFDILSETGNTSVTSVSDLPLFADYEPIHFTQPARHSYKRKRVVRFSFSEGESENEEEQFINHEVKRKKIDKFKIQQEARLREWVQDINRTFSEINEHELVIE